jgi:NAD(P) transhydrogenase
VPIDNVNVYDSDSILLLDRVPRSLAVLGGGVAGCEYASLFAALDVNVKLVDSKDRLLTWLDAELSGALEDVFKASDIDLHQRTRAAKLEPGQRDVLVTLEDGGRIVAQKVLVASGRIGNVEGLNLPAAGLAATARGLPGERVVQTAVPHIYAAGDVIGSQARVGVDGQGRVAMSHACGGHLNQRVSSILPMGIYPSPRSLPSATPRRRSRSRGTLTSWAARASRATRAPTSSARRSGS